ncbi:plant basic secretory protein [Zopfochytrium polystomum]|nr:plant basic secretory protein [Zopfochytrium polystomum]
MPWVTVNLVDSSTALVASLYSGAASHALVRSCVRNVQRTLFDRTYDSPAGIRALTVFMREMDGVAYCTGSAAEKEIHLSTAHVANHDARVRAEIEGVLVHEAVHAFQANASGSAPGGLIEGIADAVRLRCGLAPPHWRRGTDGGRRQWDSGYDATAFFLQFIEEEGEPPLPGFLKTLNMIMADPLWDDGVFVDLTGRKVEELWRLYVASVETCVVS